MPVTGWARCWEFQANLNRLFNVLRTPIEVQKAFCSKKLSLVDAEKVAWLQTSIQGEIAQRLQAGEPPVKVVSDFVQLNSTTHKNANNALATLLKGIDRAINDLGDRTGTLSSVFLFSCLPELKRTQEFVSKLIARAKKPDKASVAQLKSMKDIARELGS